MRLFNIKWNLVLILIILLVTLSKISLVGKGFLAFPDEMRYQASLNALNSFLENDFKSAIKFLTSTDSRPVDVLVKLIPCSIQLLTSKIFNIDYFDPLNSVPVFVFNYLCFIFLILIHYKVSRFLLENEYLSLFSVLLFVCLTTSHIYIRHALPYDESLFLFYFAIYLLIKKYRQKSLSLTASFFIGVLSFVAYLVYPGYFTSYFVLLLFFTYISYVITIEKRCFVLKLILFILGGIVVLSLFELLYRFVGRSFLVDSIILSQKITQGSFEESYLFIFKYLYHTEKYAGIVIIISIISMPFTLLIIYKKKQIKENHIIIILTLIVYLAYLSYATLGYCMHKMVFYGRLIHQYYPYICIILVFIVKVVFGINKNSKIFITLLAVLFIVNYSERLKSYYNITYPRDVSWLSIKKYASNNVSYYSEYEKSWTETPILLPPFHIDTSKSRLYRLVIVNSSYPWPIDDLAFYRQFIPAKDQKKIFELPHFLNYKPYQFEGFRIGEREKLDKLDLKLKVYITVDYLSKKIKSSRK
jgi:hypothetical protein